VLNILGSAYKGYEDSESKPKLKFYLDNTYVESEVDKCEELSSDIKK